MATYYVVSSPDPNPDVPHDSHWPREIAVSFEAEEVRVRQGNGHGFGGGFYDFDEFRVTDWPDFFDGWDSDWLVEALSARESPRRCRLPRSDSRRAVRRLQRTRPLAEPRAQTDLDRVPRMSGEGGR